MKIKKKTERMTSGMLTAILFAAAMLVPVSPVVAAAPPSIELTYVPAFGSSEMLQGKVTNADPDSYDVAVYIFVGGWWTKPYWDSSVTTIRKDGTWISEIVTGGSDERATEIRAYLIPKGFSPPIARGKENIPQMMEKYPYAYKERTPPTDPAPTPITTPKPSVPKSPGFSAIAAILILMGSAMIFTRKEKEKK